MADPAESTQFTDGVDDTTDPNAIDSTDEPEGV